MYKGKITLVKRIHFRTVCKRCQFYLGMCWKHDNHSITHGPFEFVWECFVCLIAVFSMPERWLIYFWSGFVESAIDLKYFFWWDNLSFHCQCFLKLLWTFCDVWKKGLRGMYWESMENFQKCCLWAFVDKCGEMTLEILIASQHSIFHNGVAHRPLNGLVQYTVHLCT